MQLPGLTEYDEALALQRRLARDRISGELPDDLILLLQHPPVITLGRGARQAHVLAPLERLRQGGIAVYEIERGGDVTYHGPGQLVGYPIIDLTRHRKDLHWYLRSLEEALLQTLTTYEIAGSRVPGYTGVWVEDRKIASIGVHVTRWVTYHGFALNVTTDLSDFELIVPCGIEQVRMTSMERESGESHSLADVGDQVARSFCKVFDLDPQSADLESVL